MKKKILFILLIGIVSLISIQCSKDKKEKKQEKNQKNYEVKSQFFYSDDAGKTYGDSRKEFKVGETVYMKINIEAIFKKDFIFSRSLDFVSCELIIPNITSVDAKYYDGTVITPFTDEISGATTYPLKIGISKNSKDDSKQEWSFTFQFIPNKESEISIRLIFDDNIAEQYDRMNTIKFVK